MSAWQAMRQAWLPWRAPIYLGLFATFWYVDVPAWVAFVWGLAIGLDAAGAVIEVLRRRWDQLVAERLRGIHLWVPHRGDDG